MSDDQDESRICANCVGDLYLRSLIEADGVKGACSRCGDEEERCVSMEGLADYVEGAFERHYYRTSTDPDMYESMLVRDKELDYDWERHGEPVLYAIAEAASIDESVAQEIVDILSDRHSDFEMAKMGEETEFDPDSYYEWKDVEDHEFAFEFQEIERSLKTERRFFNEGAEKFLDRLFDDLDGQADHQGRPVVAVAGPGREVAAFFRARVFHDNDELDAALERPDLHIGPPPSRLARAGRMNAHGVAVFYGASDPGVALAEVRPPVGSRAIVAQFELMRPMRLLDVEALRSVYVEGSIFDPAFVERLALAKFLGRLSARITMPVMPDDEPTEYLITQMIADYLAREPRPALDGILFPSAQSPGDERNVVLFRHACRVDPLQFPPGTELSARQYESTEDGPEPDYRVWEQTPPAKEEAATEKEDDPFGLGSFVNLPPFHWPLDRDDREVSLQVNLGAVSVHHVTGVTYATSEFAVRRHRFEKRDYGF